MLLNFFSVLLSWSSSSFPALVPSALQASFKLLLCHSSCLIAFNLIALPPFTRNHLGTLPGFLLRVSYMRWKRVDSNPREGECLTGYSSGLCGRVICAWLGQGKSIGAVASVWLHRNLPFLASFVIYLYESGFDPFPSLCTLLIII